MLARMCCFHKARQGDVNLNDANTSPQFSMQQSAEMRAYVAVSAEHFIDDYQQHGHFSLLSQNFSQSDASVGAIMLTTSFVLVHFLGEYSNDLGLQLRQNRPFKHTFL